MKPNLIDADGDVWVWDDEIQRYRFGPRALTEEEVQELFGPAHPETEEEVTVKPNLRDADGDVWVWDDVIQSYRFKHLVRTEDQVRHWWGPAREETNEESTVNIIKLPTIDEAVTALRVVDEPSKVYRRNLDDTRFWLDGYSSYLLGEILDEHPNGVVPAEDSDYELALRYFREAGAEAIYNTTAAEHHAVAIVRHLLDNQG